MAWIEKRNTKYEEDKAYSLFGIFDVHIPVLYGEGKQKALKRLRDKIREDYLCLAKLWSADPRDPRVEKERIEGSKGGLVTNAYRWVFDTLDFSRWRHLPGSQLLWIKGDPGKGKTMLLCGIINELERSIVAEGGNLAYFFCQATDSRINNATAVLRGLIYLLGYRQPRLLSHLPENTYPSDDAMAWIVLSKVLGGMLEDPNLKVTYLVVDALDECVTDLPKLLDLIIRISSGRVKWLLSSRNEVMIEEKLGSGNGRTRLSLELKANALQVSRAVDAYIDDKLSGLASLQHDNTLKDQVRGILHRKANGTFLWVALVVQELEQVKHWDLLQAAEEFPSDLYPLYDRMVGQIQRLSRRTLEFCEAVLATAVIAFRPLFLAELGRLSGLPEQISGSTDDLKVIVSMCGSFLTVRDNQVYLVHQSAKDYLSERASTLLFPRGVATAHHSQFARSLELMSDKLQRDMYSLSAPGFPIGHVRVPDPDPLATVRYSCVYWVNHLSESVYGTKANPDDFLQDDKAVHTFFETKYLYWLEALSLIRAMSEGIIAIRQLEGLLVSMKTQTARGLDS
ncbi:hypothetical protein VTI74DRAFT_6283 [Chaetomium olivicolor]